MYVKLKDSYVIFFFDKIEFFLGFFQFLFQLFEDITSIVEDTPFKRCLKDETFVEYVRNEYNVKAKRAEYVMHKQSILCKSAKIFACEYALNVKDLQFLL